MKCSPLRIHELVQATQHGDKNAGMEICACFSDEIWNQTRFLPANIRRDSEQQTCMRIMAKITKKICEDGFQNRELERCKG